MHYIVITIIIACRDEAKAAGIYWVKGLSINISQTLAMKAIKKYRKCSINALFLTS